MTEPELPRGVSVILPNFNGCDLLAENLPSLKLALGIAEIPWEVIVADDASTDDSVAFLRKAYPETRVVLSDTNRGFAATCNAGMAQAQYAYACIANTDVTFGESYFVEAVAAFDRSGAFALKGEILNYGESMEEVLVTERAARMQFRRGLFKFCTDGEEDCGGPYKLWFVKLGCCFVARTRELRKLGGFDEIYAPYYWEDCDLPVRAISEGLRLEYVPEMRVWHKTGSTIGKYRSKANRQLVSNRNKFIFAWQHMDLPGEWIVHVIFVVGSLAVRWAWLDWRYYAGLFLAVRRCMQFGRVRLPPEDNPFGEDSRLRS